MNRLFAFVWLILIGSNAAEHFSTGAPYHALLILAGTAYIVCVFQRELLRLALFQDYLLVLLMLVFPFLLMLLSERSFDRGTYTSQVCVALVFVIVSALALRANLDRSLAIASFVIVAIGTVLNLYELFVANNLWSSAPGRSAGFYINPNFSSEALLGYGLVFLTARVGKLRIVDLTLMVLVLGGVFSTFSRAGILASLVLLMAAAVMRARRAYMSRIVLGGMIVLLLGFGFASYVVDNMVLSNDATSRIHSLLTEGGVGDYETDRGAAASAALDLIKENPVFGAGVQTIHEMPEGPHNMFLAMMVDYGIFGLIIYVAVVLQLILSTRRANRDFSGTVLFYVAWLVIFSFVSHNLLEDTATIPLLGFALARTYRIRASACYDPSCMARG